MEPYVTSNTGNLGVTQVEFYHPSHNSLPGELLTKLAQTIEGVGASPEVSVIILKSGGDRTFCAGASFEELINIQDLPTGKRFFMGFANVINACRKCPKLIIGRIQGKAVGGGVGLAAATDYCLATKFASVKLSELNIGIGPFVVGPAVERKIGVSAFSQLAINANTFYDASWAKEKGLYAQVYQDQQALDHQVSELAEYLARTNYQARVKLKEIFWQGCEHWDDLLEERAAVSGELVLSDETKKALARFKTSTPK